MKTNRGLFIFKAVLIGSLFLLAQNQALAEIFRDYSAGQPLKSFQPPLASQQKLTPDSGPLVDEDVVRERIRSGAESTDSKHMSYFSQTSPLATTEYFCKGGLEDLMSTLKYTPGIILSPGLSTQEKNNFENIKKQISALKSNLIVWSATMDTRQARLNDRTPSQVLELVKRYEIILEKAKAYVQIMNDPNQTSKAKEEAKEALQNSKLDNLDAKYLARKAIREFTDSSRRLTKTCTAPNFSIAQFEKDFDQFCDSGIRAVRFDVGPWDHARLKETARLTNGLQNLKKAWHQGRAQFREDSPPVRGAANDLCNKTVRIIALVGYQSGETNLNHGPPYQTSESVSLSRTMPVVGAK